MSHKIVAPYSIWKRMRELTGKKIEKRAIFEIVNFIEEQIDKIILQSLEEFESLNEMRRIQGFYQRTIMDAECVKRAIKNIYPNNYYILPKRAGGDEGEEDRKENKHPQFLREMIGYG
ncbi:MAG TPA: hypothetical protein ENI33_08850 [Thermoplasmatales archaeon]|nr:hypothetical protein [Thermoplasmatales archaeon]